MKLLIFGASGRTGRALVGQALDQGHSVTAFVREPSTITRKHEHLEVVQGDLASYDSVASAMAGQDAVLSALGVRVPTAIIVVVAVLCQVAAHFMALSWPLGLLVRVALPVVAVAAIMGKTTVLSSATRNIVAAMQRSGVKRFICASSLGIGDSKGQLGLWHNLVVIPLVLRNIFTDKEIQERIIRDSSLDWELVRPGVLTNRPRTGVYRAGFAVSDTSITGTISRADLAHFMLRQLTDDGRLRLATGLSY